MVEQGKPTRRSIRLKDYDYSQAGAYFVTICVHYKRNFFGEIIDGCMQLTHTGEIVQSEWLRTEVVRPNVAVDEFIVMPNHLHGIVVIAEADIPVGATRRVARAQTHGPVAGSIGAIVGQFKSTCTKQIRKNGALGHTPIWQRSYFEHVIRTQDELDRVRLYIVENPLKWELDRENPVARTTKNDEPWKPSE
jgi:REP element-mobilizing transposase RayT